MAWSLSQIAAVGLPGSGMTFNEETEHYIAFYDLFVNHAFGNYRQIMEEFSFNVIMGSWLSFIGNKSLQKSIDEDVSDSFWYCIEYVADTHSLINFSVSLLSVSLHETGQGKLSRRELCP